MTPNNFESKKISLEEILSMDTNRILEGEISDEIGNEYNGKIKQLQREINQIPDIGRYRYKVVFLANVDSNLSISKLRLLSGGLPVEIINFEACYKNLLLPVLTGTYYNASDLQINLNLSNKSSGSKISYTVMTEFKECDITVLFVPTYEIGKLMSKYRNSILKFNPRSYLEAEGKNVNSEIKKTLLSKITNEFALFNNGITMLSDETGLNELIGQKDRAQLTVKNPQIINGGQTAYTLSKIYDEVGDDTSVFEGKEVLLKVITFHDNTINASDKRALITEISKATNQQSVVTNADKKANDDVQIYIQEALFEKFGILYERKRGEFSDGILNGYVDKSEILDRNVFSRLFYLANNNIDSATKNKNVFVSSQFTIEDIDNEELLNSFINSYHIYKKFEAREKKERTRKRIAQIVLKVDFVLNIANKLVKSNQTDFSKMWDDFILFCKSKPENSKFIKFQKNILTGEESTIFDESRYIGSRLFQSNLEEYLETFST
jgi:hypothetical protein